MVNSFACPECGAEIWPGGLSPGRTVRCESCDTLVEVPFLPRAATRYRSGSQFDWLVPWFWVVGAALVLLIVVLGAAKVFQSGRRSVSEYELQARVAASQEAERSGHLEKAVAEADAALSVARDKALLTESQRDELKNRRDKLALRHAQQRLEAALSNPDDSAAVDELVAISKQSAEHPALDPIAERVRAAALARADAELTKATEAIDRQDSGDIMKRAERVMRAAADLPPPDGPRLRDAARVLAKRVILERGVEFAPVTGAFRLGSPAGYYNLLHEPLADALRKRGYEPHMKSSPFSSLWEGNAPFRMVIEIIQESVMPRHAGSAQAGTRIEARLSLMRKGTPCLSITLQSRTRSKPEKMGDREYSMMLVADNPDSKYERLLYEDSRDALVGQILQKVLLLSDPKNVCGPSY
jgi:hypothetical protein